MCLVAFIVSFKALSTDLGQLGKSYPIIEPDLIETIKTMLQKKQDSGEMDVLNERLKGNAKTYVQRPPGVSLPKAAEYRGFAVDPTYTVSQDIRDAHGKVLFPAGYTINPLTIKPLTKALCFIDGDDVEQVQWLEKYCPDNYRFKRILVNGDFNLVTKKTKSRVYFDQKGYLISHFRIKALPAVVRQSGGLLYVEEFKI